MERGTLVTCCRSSSSPSLSCHQASLSLARWSRGFAPHRWPSSALPKPRTFKVLAAEDEPGDPSSTSTSSSSVGNISAEELEIKLGKRSKRPRKSKSNVAVTPKPPPKDWDSMTLPEKAWELYIGEKGALFWINKLAYAAIFLIIGGWIVFRFIGPALGWYQLESSLLPPNQVFGGPP